MVEDVRFHRYSDGQVALVGDRWPQEIEVSRELLDTGAPMVCDNGEGGIEFTVANGCAFYQITGTRNGTGIVEPVHEVVSARLVNGHVGIDP